MRRGILGSFAALAAGAGAAWGQDGPAAFAPTPVGMATVDGGVVPAAGNGPGPVIMPPLPGVPPGGPPMDMGGPPGAFAPQPPVPMYPPPGPYGAPLFQGPPEPGRNSYPTAPHFWTSAEYLLLVPRNLPGTPPLVTTGDPFNSGLPGATNTRVLAGGTGSIDLKAASGARFTTGLFLDPNRRLGIEASGFFVDKVGTSDTFNSTGLGLSVLARPFVDSTTGVPNALLVANPSLGAGTVRVDTSSRAYGAEGNAVLNLYRTSPESARQFTLDFLAGYRYMEVSEQFAVRTQTLTFDPAVTGVALPTISAPFLPATGSQAVLVAGVALPTPVGYTTLDQFRVDNRFNGGQVGFRSQYRYGAFSANLGGKFAYGDMESRVSVQGSTAAVSGSTNANGTNQSTNALGGLFTNANNVGFYKVHNGAYIPELNVGVGVHVSRTLAVNFGYNLIYVSDVIRPTRLVNGTVDATTVPLSQTFGAGGSTPAPGLNFARDSYTLQGFTVGLDLKY